ncbi:MAG: hypothetical protein SRB2_03144 [Desulfobacteraceae bacterium Eth-SRB2]|nr:MAG: hypothetical protein SRB2_03144 [Desulfobacteraceae bacterium Eth-SRB2]
MTHTVSFKTKNFSSPVDDARLMFWFANDAAPGDIFWIDNVVIAKAGSVPPPSDIVMNPGFEDGKTWWDFYTSGQGSFVVSSPGYGSTNAAKVTTVAGGTNIQLYQYGIPLEPNTDYQLSFNAYSSSGHGLDVSILKHDLPYTNYGLSHEQINLGTSWNTHTVNFRTKNFSAPVDDARLMFWFANDAAPGDIFWIDNVVIAKAGSSPPPPASDIVMNPGFEDGETWWDFYTSGQGSFVVSSPGYGSTNAAKVTTVTGGTNIQLYQYGIPLEPNTDYQLSFNAYSSSGHGLDVSILKHDPPYTNYGLSHEPVNLTTNWSTFTLNFSTNNFGSPVDDARLMFWFANDAAPGDIFWIDNVVIAPLN